MVKRAFRNRLIKFLQRSDFRQNPVKAVYKRIYWRTHWALLSQRPFFFNFHKGLTIGLAHSSASSGIYFNDGFSDKSIADLFIRFLRPGMVALDCGAHIGEYTLLFSILTGPTGETHSFEPNPKMFEYLKTNVALNNLKNVFLANVGLSDFEGDSNFVLSDDPTTSYLRHTEGSTGSKGSKEIRVSVTTLDQYVLTNNIKRLDALKIDVEGAEANVLKGAREVLVRFKPGLIFIECEDKDTPSSLSTWLGSLGYEARVATDGSHLYPHLIAKSLTSEYTTELASTDS
jgi:FkbM family methyltransferase